MEKKVGVGVNQVNVILVQAQGRKRVSREGQSMRVNVGADNFFENDRKMRKFFEKKFNRTDIKVKYDSRRRRNRACH